MSLLCQNIKTSCCGLTVPGHQVPKASLSLPSTADREHIMTGTGSWAEIGSGRDHSLITVVGKSGNFFNLLPIKSE